MTALERVRKLHKLGKVVGLSRRDAQSDELLEELKRHLVTCTGKDPARANARDWYAATASLIRERVAHRWIESHKEQDRWASKRVYYLSMEFLLGRLLSDALRNLGLYESFRNALAGAGLDLEGIAAAESEAALGNGGLGRLAACLLESTATLGIPAYGYGLRFEYGLFTQKIKSGWQVERPEHWLRHGNSWEFPRIDVVHAVPFNGRLAGETGAAAKGARWVDADEVFALAYDLPVPGYDSACVNTLRLWSAKARREFDTGLFHEGEHVRALEGKTKWENLTRTLYPNDANEAGRELRFKQEHFFVSASVQDILSQYLSAGLPLERLAEKVSIAINDTHPSLVVAELMRLLVDVYGLALETAFDIVRRTVSYTNHTLMPEALEAWPVRFFERLLPRHLELILWINDRVLEDARRVAPAETGLAAKASLVEESGERRIRMAHLAFAGSHKVNGVSKIHTALMRRTTFAELDRVYPDRIVNVTNGVTPRRWLLGANRALAELVTAKIGPAWIKSLECIEALAPFADDAEFRQAFRAIKQENKERFARHAERACGEAPDPKALVDAHIKRFHEYKRQLLKALHAVTLYARLREGQAESIPPRTIVFAGKAAPGYAAAKLIIKLVHDIAHTINGDARVGDRLKVLFVPNYGVADAEIIIPAADLSEQISTAGTEACGTGSMKLALNGALTIGTRDGANVEIAQAVGAESFFGFGLGVEEADRLRAGAYAPRAVYEKSPALREAIDLIADGYFSRDEPARFHPLVDTLLDRDPFLVLADYESYVACQGRVEALFRDEEEWTRRAILSMARMGRFSSDRAVREYAAHIWGAAIPADDHSAAPALPR